MSHASEPLHTSMLKETDPVGGDTAHGLAHPVPMSLLLGIFGLLMVLTAATYGAALIDLGPFNIVLALLIAVVKASLVGLYFMHLRWDSPFNAVILIASLFFVALFIGVAIMDTTQYKVNYQAPTGSGMTP